ncbi:MAG TPA: hypothetical protein PKN44_14670, partial [Bacteroidales bacterium]|nr:hypothetical protein [Bacteroidales bacterium]
NEPEELTISPFIQRAMTIADAVSIADTKKEIVVTSILDGVHSSKSLHYKGLAFDMRTHIYTQYELSKLMNNLKYMLGANYDVVLEKDHIHIEYDPK